MRKKGITFNYDSPFLSCYDSFVCSGELLKCSELLSVLESSYSIDSERPLPFKWSLLKSINQVITYLLH